MVDSLSVSASIGGLVTLADTVFSRTYRYVKVMKNAPKDGSILSSETGALSGILSNLCLLSEQLESEGAQFTTRVQHIRSCQKTLEKVKSILERDSTSSLQDQHSGK